MTKPSEEDKLEVEEEVKEKETKSHRVRRARAKREKAKKAEVEEYIASVKQKEPSDKKSPDTPEKGDKPPFAVAAKLGYGLHSVFLMMEKIVDSLSGVYKELFVVSIEKKDAFFKEQGLNHFARQNYNKAVECLLTYIDKGNPEDIDALFHIGAAYSSMEQYEEAIGYLKRASELEKDDNEIISELVSCLVETKKYKQAIFYLKKAIDLDPEQSRNFYLLGSAFEGTGKPEKAFDMYKRAIEIDPKEPLFYQSLGFAYESAEKHDDAIGCFKKAMELEKHK